MQADVNIWAILVSMALSVGLGFIWYGPLFGKKWMALSGIAAPAQKPPFKAMIKPIALSFSGALLISYVVSLASAGIGARMGMLVSLFAWLGFVVPVYLNFAGWEGRPWTLFLINAGYWLVYLLAIGALIGAWA